MIDFISIVIFTIIGVSIAHIISKCNSDPTKFSTAGSKYFSWFSFLVTLYTWLGFSIYKPSNVYEWIGWILTLISLIISLYGLGLYKKRE